MDDQADLSMSVRRARCRRAAPVWTLVVSVVWLASCSDPEAHNGAPAAGAGEAVDVVTAAAALKPFGVRIEAVGTARANESVDVTSKASNTVSAIRFEEGDRVRRGAVLVELDGAEARASLAEAEAALAESESQFKRSRDLFAQQALSDVAARSDRSDAEGQSGARRRARRRGSPTRSFAPASTAAPAFVASASAASSAPAP